MDIADRRTLCTALGFAIVLLRGGEISPGQQAARAHALASLIDAFCQDAAQPALIDRMALAMAGINRDQGNCLPQDLVARGFAPAEVEPHWTLVKALAAVEQILVRP